MADWGLLMASTQVIRCPACGSLNRVPLDRVAQGLTPVCGKCKSRIPVDLHPVTVTDATFLDEVARSPLPVVLDMWAAWCGPCRQLAPLLDELATQYAGRLKIAKLNVDENPDTAARFNVRSLPTLLVFNRGRETDRIVGLQPKDAIARRLEPLIA